MVWLDALRKRYTLFPIRYFGLEVNKKTAILM